MSRYRPNIIEITHNPDTQIPSEKVDWLLRNKHTSTTYFSVAFDKMSSEEDVILVTTAALIVYSCIHVSKKRNFGYNQT